MKRFALLFSMVGWVWLQASSSALAADKPVVVATYSILGDLVDQVAADAVDLRVLVGPDGDAHVFEPTPQDGKTLAQAALIFENGAGFETWLSQLYLASKSRARRVVVSKGLQLREIEEESEHEDHDDGHHEDDHHNRDRDVHDHHHRGHRSGGGIDPHIWHDANNAIHMVRKIEKALGILDPGRKSFFAKNAKRYIKKLKKLDAEIAEKTASVPADHRKLVTSHDTFGYFADRYGYEVIGAAIPSMTTEAEDPSAQAVVKLVQKIRSAGVPVIFAENVSNTTTVDLIAREAGVRTAPTLYTDALGAPGTPGDSYVGMMRHNASVIAESLTA